jgi:glycosyltransferase involved in cell wall biosynthesis
MKILHLIDSGGLYGAEMMLISLAAQQQLMGASVVIGSIRKPALPEKPLEQESRKRSIPVRLFEMKPGLNILGAYEILRYAQYNKFDVIHSHGYKTNILLGLLPRFIRRIPFVSTLHGWTSTGRWTKMRVNELLDSLALRCVDRIILVNQGMLDKKEIKALPRNKISIINNGVDIPTSKEPTGICEYPEKSLENKVNKFCSQGIIIASIGRLSVEKGYNYLIEAVSSLSKYHAQYIKLLLIGDGRLRSELQQQAEAAGLKDFFLITGYLKNARNLISLADIYVISSLTEGLPISLLEAMASGTPIVATAVGGIPHVVQDRKEALLVSSQSPQALVGAINELIQFPALARSLAKNSAAKVKQHYSSKGMAEEYTAVYKEILVWRT